MSDQWRAHLSKPGKYSSIRKRDVLKKMSYTWSRESANLSPITFAVGRFSLSEGPSSFRVKVESKSQWFVGITELQWRESDPEKIQFLKDVHKLSENVENDLELIRPWLSKLVFSNFFGVDDQGTFFFSAFSPLGSRAINSEAVVTVVWNRTNKRLSFSFNGLTITANIASDIEHFVPCVYFFEKGTAEFI